MQDHGMSKIAREFLLELNSGANKTHISQKIWCVRSMNMDTSRSRYIQCTYPMQTAERKQKKTRIDIESLSVGLLLQTKNSIKLHILRTIKPILCICGLCSYTSDIHVA